MASVAASEPAEGVHENPHITALVKNMRTINKKINGMAKTDAVIKENPGVSLDDLVAQRKINQDQKASALKKPQLQAQLAALEEQVQQHKRFDAELQTQLKNQKEELTSGHGAELEKLKKEAQAEAVAHGEAELKKKLLVFSQFLRAAAARRNAEEDQESDENRAFEGTLLLVYGGDQKAVDTALSLIEGSDESVTSIEGSLLPVKFSQVKQASVTHDPYPSEEAYDEPTPETTTNDTLAAGSDPTTAHAGLTELQQTNGVPASTEDTTAPTTQAEGNVAGERWDTTTGAEKEGLEEENQVFPRPNNEVDTPAASEPVDTQHITNWADEASAGNQAGESWDTKVPGQEAASDAWAPTNGTAEDAFQEVPAKTRGGRGGRGRGDGQSRGGRGNGRGRGGPYRGARGDGEGRGRGGRGRGPRGDGNAPARS